MTKSAMQKRLSGLLWQVKELEKQAAAASGTEKRRLNKEVKALQDEAGKLAEEINKQEELPLWLR